MSQELLLPKGADHSHTIRLLDENNNLIPGATITKLVIIVRHANGTEIAKFSKNAASGYKLIDITNIATGLVKINLLSSHTVGKPSGKLFYEIHGLIPDVSITDDVVLDLISTGNYLCTLIDSITGGTSLP